MKVDCKVDKNKGLIELDLKPINDYKKLKIGDILEKNDIVYRENWASLGAYKVVRVTKTLAFIKFNSHSESKLPRLFSYGFQTLPKDRYNMTKYEVFRLKNNVA